MLEHQLVEAIARSHIRLAAVVHSARLAAEVIVVAEQ